MDQVALILFAIVLTLIVGAAWRHLALQIWRGQWPQPLRPTPFNAAEVRPRSRPRR